MKKIHLEASSVIGASAAELYAVIADYRVGHPAILPKRYFVSLTVEKGGQGAGTIIRTRMKGGTKSEYHMVVAEPEPGRVLTESSLDDDLVTVFKFDPIGDGRQTRVTITTDYTAQPGFKGLIEKLSQKMASRLVYQPELKNLTNYVAGKK